MEKGTAVIIVNSNHPDVRAGDEGIIDSKFDDGYGVELTKAWPDPVRLGQTKLEPRVLFFKTEFVTQK